MKTLPKAIAGFLIFCNLFLIVAVLDYSPQDPSYFNATDKVATNITASYGAKIADPLIQALGYGIIGPLLLSIGLCILKLVNYRVRLLLLKISLLLYSLPLFCTLVASFDSQQIMDGDYYSFRLGGYLGYFIHSELLFSEYHAIAKYVIYSLLSIIILFEIGLIEKIFVRSNDKKPSETKLNTKLYEKLFKKVAQQPHFKKPSFENPDIRFKTANDIKEIVTIKNSNSNPNFDFHKTFSFKVQNPSTSEKEIELPEQKPPIKSSFTIDPETTLEVEIPVFGIKDPVIKSRSIFKEKEEVVQKGFILPKVISISNDEADENSDEEIEIQKHRLISVLNEFGISGTITEVFHGPVVTLYAFEPLPGTKSSRIIGLADDIARSMKVQSARISIIQGQNAIGIEIPNDKRKIININELLSCSDYQNSDAALPLALGKNVIGNTIVVDLAKMPHLLIAGTTGSGKSVGIHTMLLSLLYKYGPEDCKLIMIDPKMLEMSMYEGIPHLAAPVIIDPDQAVATLKWLVQEMSSRYKLMSTLGVRNIISYNKIINEAKEQNAKIEKKVHIGFDDVTKQQLVESILIEARTLPYIVVVIDEIADLMSVAGKEVENCVQRLAQMARAAGIHLIIATQRPSVDVITGVIKANFPTRISFQVTSRFDSRTVLGEIGAEQLLGAGDMLYMAPGGKIERIHGPFVEDSQIHLVVQHVKSQGSPSYLFKNSVKDTESD